MSETIAVMAQAQTDLPIAVLGLVLGSVVLGFGISIRLGGSRRLLRPYFLPNLPTYLRNAPLAYIPIGLFFALGTLGGLLEVMYGTKALALITTVFVIAVLSIPVLFWWMLRPPDFAKPAWLRAEEAAARAGLTVPDHRPPRPSVGMYAAGWAVTSLLLPVGLVVGVPLPPLLMGVGLGASLLLTNPPSRAADLPRRFPDGAR